MTRIIKSTGENETANARSAVLAASTSLESGNGRLVGRYFTVPANRRPVHRITTQRRPGANAGGVGSRLGVRGALRARSRKHFVGAVKFGERRKHSSNRVCSAVRGSTSIPSDGTTITSLQDHFALEAWRECSTRQTLRSQRLEVAVVRG